MRVTNGHYVFVFPLSFDYVANFRLVPNKIPASAVNTTLDFEKKTATHYGKKGNPAGVSMIETQGEYEYPCLSKPLSSPNITTEQIGFNAEYLSMPRKFFGAARVKMVFSGATGCCSMSFNNKNGLGLVMYLMPEKVRE